MLYKKDPLEISPELYYTLVEKLNEKTDFFDYNLPTTFLSEIIKGDYEVWTNDHIIVLGNYKLYETGLGVMEFTVVNHSDNQYDGFLDDMKLLESWCEGGAIDRIILDGRAGWRKMFKDYTHSSTIIYKDINNGLENS